ncbi:MAG: GTP 3',8-cyclase MoaA [Coriobacteriia bacterium]|nr:GTP 3',8-cyclase MoaA [Coriobacteriia bacterium]
MATDSYGRRIDYLRISLTDRCNLRCIYCMPANGVAWKPHDEILTLEEIERFAAAAVGEGISKIRLTGGEPLVRKGVVSHVRRLKALTGLEAIALTTNGTLLERYAVPLVEAGLTRVNISIDSLDAAAFERVTRGGKLADALGGLDAAFEAGMGPIKVNAVVVRSLKQDLLDFARMTLDRPVHVRFIEYMPIGGVGEGECEPAGEGWTHADHVPADEILERLAAEGTAAGIGAPEPVKRAAAPGGWGPARYYRYPGAEGTVGVITPLSHHFCGECNRLRLTADGRLRACLFSDEEIDVRTVLREGTDEDVREVIRTALATKPESHSMRVGTTRGMSQIGG